MAHVIVLESVSEDIFVCGNCKTVFNSLTLFLQHKKNICLNGNTSVLDHVDNNTGSDSKTTYEYETCNVGIGKFYTVKQTDTERENTAVCSICTKTFRKMKSLLVHMKIHSEKSYQCLICGRCFVQNSHLQRHVNSHKVWPDGLSQTTAKSLQVELLSYSCPYCDMVLPNYGKFRAHLKNHLNLKRFKCTQGECKCFFEDVECLLNHISIYHNPPVYTCHKCSINFDSLLEIAKHYQNHDTHENSKINKKNRLKCSQCDATFKKPEKLSLHMLTESHKKTCIHCHKTFTSDKRLRLHLQIHRNIKPFQCIICGQKFSMKKYLTTHMLKHGERIFNCNVCSSKFKRQDLLQRHIKSHQNYKFFKCPFKDTLDCKMEFSRSDKLKSHIKHHTKHLSNTIPSK